MSAERATYLDSSALVKLVVEEPESDALRRYMRRWAPFVSSALAQVELSRAVLLLGDTARRRARNVLARVGLINLGRRQLLAAGELEPAELRALDAIHIAAALSLGESLRRVVAYDNRLAEAARAAGLEVVAPS